MDREKTIELGNKVRKEIKLIYSLEQYPNFQYG